LIRTMQVNVVDLSYLIPLLVNDMISRKSGHIPNLASTSAWVPISDEKSYTVTKAFCTVIDSAIRGW
jgi:short-subunit dehydrogenase